MGELEEMCIVVSFEMTGPRPGNRFHSAGEVSIKLFILYQLSNNATVYNGVRALSLSEIETEKSSPRLI